MLLLGNYGIFAPGIWGRLPTSVFTGTAAAYALRIPAGSTYSGPLIRARRSSDNAEQNFSSSGIFDANGDRWLDTNALLSFVGAGSGFVTTWYDQSGIGRHLVQATAANQPRIVNAGVLDVKNSQPSLVFSGNQFLRIASGFTYTSNCVVFAGQYNSPNSVNQGFFQFGSTNSNGSMLVEGTILQIRVSTGDGSSTTVDYSGALRIFTGEWGASLRRLRVNGADIGTTTTANTFTANNTSLNVGNLANAYPLTGFLSEVVVIGAAISATQRQSIERSQGAAYGITIP